MCLGGPHRVVEILPRGTAVTQDLNGKKELAFSDSVPDVAVGDYVLVAHRCITSKLDPAVAEQAIAAMAGLVSDEPFALKSALGDDVYQPSSKPAQAAPPEFPGQFAFAFG